MKVYLLKDIEQVGMAGEMVRVKDGFAFNYLIPKKLAVRVSKANMPFFKQHAREVEKRKEVIASKTSMLAEKIRTMKLTLKRKLHNGNKLYGSISPQEIADLLGENGVNIGKSQVQFDKSIKEKGLHTVTIKLTSKLNTSIQIKVVAEDE